jgi:hypothetical protein
MMLPALIVRVPFNSLAYAQNHAVLMAFSCLQPGEDGEWGQVDAPAAEALFRLKHFLENGMHQEILDLNLPELHGYTIVSSARI